MANQEIVPASAFTRGMAERRKSATTFSLPGFASNGTYSANFDITFSSYKNHHCEELQHRAWVSIQYRNLNAAVQAGKVRRQQLQPQLTTKAVRLSVACAQLLMLSGF
jgi:hypothetical protein